MKREEHQCRERALVQLPPPSLPLAEINLHLFSLTCHASHHHLTPKKGLFLHTQSRTETCFNQKCVLSQFPSEAMYLSVSSVDPATPSQASLSITNSRRLLKLMSIESLMPSNHLILWWPILLPSIFPSIRVFSKESVLHIRWPKYWSFSISPPNEYSGLISFRIDWLDPYSPRNSRVFSSTTVQKHQFFNTQLSL